MFSSTATPTNVVMGSIPLPAGTVLNPAVAYEFNIKNSGGTTVRSWQGPNTSPPPFDIAALPSGGYTLNVGRLNSLGAWIGTPASAPFTLDQTIDVPVSVAVTLA